MALAWPVDHETDLRPRCFSTRGGLFNLIVGIVVCRGPRMDLEASDRPFNIAIAHKLHRRHLSSHTLTSSWHLRPGANAALMAVEADLGLLGPAGPAWTGLEADLHGVHVEDVEKAIEHEISCLTHVCR